MIKFLGILFSIAFLTGCMTHPPSSAITDKSFLQYPNKDGLMSDQILGELTRSNGKEHYSSKDKRNSHGEALIIVSPITKSTEYTRIDELVKKNMETTKDLNLYREELKPLLEKVCFNLNFKRKIDDFLYAAARDEDSTINSLKYHNIQARELKLNSQYKVKLKLKNGKIIPMKYEEVITSRNTITETDLKTNTVSIKKVEKSPYNPLSSTKRVCASEEVSATDYHKGFNLYVIPQDHSWNTYDRIVFTWDFK